MEVLLRNALRRAQDHGSSGMAAADLAAALAELLVFRGQPEKAWALVRNILAEHPDHAGAVWWDARLGFQLGSRFEL